MLKSVRIYDKMNDRDATDAFTNEEKEKRNNENTSQTNKEKGGKGVFIPKMGNVGNYRIIQKSGIFAAFS